MIDKYPIMLENIVLKLEDMGYESGEARYMIENYFDSWSGASSWVLKNPRCGGGRYAVPVQNAIYSLIPKYLGKVRVVITSEHL